MEDKKIEVATELSLLSDEVVGEAVAEVIPEILQIPDEPCPDCGSDVFQRVGHCRTCAICGWSMCEI